LVFVLTGKVPNRFQEQGAPPFLRKEDELALGRWASHRADCQQAVPRDIFYQTASLIHALRHQQDHGTPPSPVWQPTDGWWDGFSGRMKKWGEPLRRARPKIRNAKGPTREEANSWFADLYRVLIEIGIIREGRSQTDIRDRIINVDESAAVDRLDSKHLRVIVPPHKEGTVALAKPTNDHITLVGAVTASGKRFPPFFILKGTTSPLALQNTKKRMHESSPNTGWEVQENGWIDSRIWLSVLEWIVALVTPPPSAANPIIIIADCHSTRYSYAALQWALEHHCHVFTLPPNSTHFLQPLDVGVFSAFKSSLRQLMLDKAIGDVALNKTSIPPLVCKAWEAGATESNILAGWRACGMGLIDRFVPSSLLVFRGH
jgi:hypothetical protein